MILVLSRSLIVRDPVLPFNINPECSYLLPDFICHATETTAI